jgi:hypothetical protein
MRSLRRFTLIALLTAVLGALAPSAASAACGNPYWWANPNKDTHGGWAPGVGFRAYSVGIASYVSKCSGGWVRARHGVYIDTRAFPYGYKFMFSVSTRRSDGVWKRVRSKSGASIFLLSGKQEIQEVLLYQRRYTPRGMRLTDVHVRHCACSIGSGAIPVGSTLKGQYKRFYGPEASPG